MTLEQQVTSDIFRYEFLCPWREMREPWLIHVLEAFDRIQERLIDQEANYGLETDYSDETDSDEESDDFYGMDENEDDDEEEDPEMPSLE